MPGFETLAQDVRYGLRMMLKSRGFSLVAIVSLAAGIGFSTVLFSVANAFLFRPLPAANASELLQVFTSDFDGPSLGSCSYPDYEAFRDRGEAFTGLLAATRARAALSGQPGLLSGVLVSANYFDVLGLQPSRGRFFQPDENRTPASHPVVVLAHDTWQRRFGSDPAIIGQAVSLNGHGFTVIGVGPPRFAGLSFDYAAEFFAPVMMQSVFSPGDDMVRSRGARRFTVLGRPKPGVTPRQAESALRVVAAQLLLEAPREWRDRTGQGRTVTVMPEVEARVARAAPGATVWLFSSVIGAVVVLLGIACVNVATVLLARAATRRREIAVRLAIGASRRRMIRQLLTECALLAAAGGTLGVLLAHWTARLFARFRPDEAPPFDLTLDYRILVFALGASCLTVLFCGLAPALQATRPDINAELAGAVRAFKVRRLRIGLRDALVIVQVAVSLALIVGAGLMYRSFRAGMTEDPGFRRGGVLNLDVDLSTLPGGRPAQERFFREAVQAVEGVAGVDKVALAALVPMDGSNRKMRIQIDRGGSMMPVSPDTNTVGPGYFALMDVDLLRGREFTPLDRANAPRVAVVNEMMARQYFDGNALGQTLIEGDDKVSVEIVGVVRDLRHRSFAEEPLPMVYFPADQYFSPRMTIHIRSAVAPAALGASVQQLLRELHPAAGLGRPRTMTEYMEFVTMPQRLGGAGAAVTGLMELGLAVMALYGVIAFAAAQRTREIGLRMALGASGGSVVRLVMRDGLVLAGAGIGLGILAALGAGPVLGSLLIGVGAFDPVSFGVAAGLLFLVAAIASYLPARRALRVDPSTALRTE